MPVALAVHCYKGHRHNDVALLLHRTMAELLVFLLEVPEDPLYEVAKREDPNEGED